MLTAKQTAAINRAPKSDRARLNALFVAQSGKSRQPLPVGLQPTRPKPSTASRTPPKRPQRVPRSRLNALAAFDGFNHYHLPTDESTSAYATTNFVTTYDFATSNDVDKIIVVAPRHYSTLEGNSITNLTDILALEYDASISHTALAILGSARSPILRTPTIVTDMAYTAVRGRIHNLSAEVECLGTSIGLIPPGSIYVGNVPYIEGAANSGLGTKTLKETWAEDSIAVGYLKSFSSAGLVHHPVRVHANVAENVSYKQWKDFVVPASAVNLATLRLSNALEPIVIYVPRVGQSGTIVNFRLNIGHQWCTRWPNDPAMRATQEVHKPTSPDLWNEATTFLRGVGTTFANAAAMPLGTAAGRRMAAEFGPAGLAMA